MSAGPIGDRTKPVVQARVERQAPPSPASTAAQPVWSAATTAAAAKYIAEREQKRLQGFDIPAHRLYSGEEGSVRYGGLRAMNGEQFALLVRADGVIVLPVSPVDAQRLRKMRVGRELTLAPGGRIGARRRRL